MLHHRLRAGTAPAALIASVSRVESLLAEREFLSVLGTTLTPLHELDTEVSALLFERESEALPQWVGVLWLLPAALIVCVLAIVFTPFLTFAVLAMLGIVVLIMAAQNVMRLRVELWNREAKSLRYLLARVSVLGNLARAQHHPEIAEFAPLADKASEINRAITPSVWLDVIPGAADFAEWYLLRNIRHYANSLRTIDKHREFLQRCFEQIANLAACRT